MKFELSSAKHGIDTGRNERRLKSLEMQKYLLIAMAVTAASFLYAEWAARDEIIKGFRRMAGEAEKYKEYVVSDTRDGQE